MVILHLYLEVQIMMEIQQQDQITNFIKRFFVPLPFFFLLENIGLALPLCALSREEIKIKLSLETSANLKGDVDTITLESFKLYGDFVLLEGAERQKFQQSALTYLIETPQRLNQKYYT